MAQLEVLKKVTNGVIYKDFHVMLQGVRVSFPHLSKPFAGKDDTNPDGTKKAGKYGIVAMLPKATHVALKDAIKEQIEALLAANKDSKGEIPKVAKDKWCLRNGDDQEQTEYSGHWTLSARESRKPSVRKRSGEIVTEPAAIDDLIQGGYWANILIRLWYQDGVKVGAGYGKRINAGLVGVQLVKEDETFGEGRIDDSDAWASEGGDGNGLDDDPDGL